MARKQFWFTRTLAIQVATIAAMLCAADARAQFEPTLEWNDLPAVNAREQTSLPAYELNTALSQLRLTGAFYTNHPASYWLTIDATRGLAYWPEMQAGSWPPPFYGGTIAVLDLKTLQVLRRFDVYDGDELVAPAALVHDPVGNRLFVSDWYGRKIAIVDAVSGDTIHVRTFPFNAVGMLYSHTTNCLIVYNIDAHFPAPMFAWNLGDLNSELLPMDLTGFPPGHLIDSYPVGSDESKLYYLAYTDLAGEAIVYAFDMNPASLRFGQIVWTTTGSVGRAPGRNGNVWVQPTLDPVKGHLYVPDLHQGRLRVFDARQGVHPEMPSIPFSDFGPLEPNEISRTGTINPTVDPVTGLLYVLVDIFQLFDDGNSIIKTSLVTIDSDAGIVARAPAPRSIEEAPGAGIFVDPGTRRVLLTTGEWGRTLAVYHDGRSSSMLTPPSTGPITILSPEANLTFASVSSEGHTSVAPLSADQLPSALPGAFSVGGALLYDVSTTAAVAGPITICFNAGYVESPAAFDALRVLHFESGNWVDRTTSVDYLTRTVCATTNSLSPFVLARLTSPWYTPRLLYSTDRSFKARSTAPLKIQVLDWSGNNISSSDLTLTVASLRRTGDDAAVTVDDSGSANPDFAFRYDVDIEGYIYNVSTKGLSAGSYSLTVDVGGQGRYIQLPFSVR